MTRYRAVAALGGALALLAADRADAQLWPFGGYHGPSNGRRRGIRPQRRPVPAPEATAEVPLPVARPHFPGDPPGDGAAPAAPAPPLGPQNPVAPKPADGRSGPAAPAPPAKPAEVKPAEVKPGAPPPGKAAEPAKPGVAPSGARLGETPRQPDTDAACPDRLKARGVEAEPVTIGPQPDARCTVVQPVRLKGLKTPDGGTVDFPEHPTVACPTADAFSIYVRDLLSPLAKGTYGTPVAAVWTGPGLECRSRDHIFGAKLSAHGQGLAIDIAQFKLGDGRLIEVGQPKDDRGQSFETAARNAACGYFHTVLGPGSDSYHRTHWHFDLEVRGAHGDSKFCK